MPTALRSGSAERWGPLWGDRAGEWAATEEQQAPAYEEAIRRVGVHAGQDVLDIGCGSGVFLERVAERGAQVCGLDASEPLLELARERVPTAELRSGDMQFLPYEDDSFDLVTGFNSFFFAQDMVAALREAGRVARPNAPVVIQVFGRPERCDLEAVKMVLRPFLPSSPPGAPPAPMLWQPGALEELAVMADLRPVSSFDFSYAMDYPDAETLGRRLIATAGVAKIVGPAHEEVVRTRIVEVLAPHRGPEGSYRLHNELHYLVATRPDGRAQLAGASRYTLGSIRAVRRRYS